MYINLLLMKEITQNKRQRWQFKDMYFHKHVEVNKKISKPSIPQKISVPNERRYYFLPHIY